MKLSYLKFHLRTENWCVISLKLQLYLKHLSVWCTFNEILTSWSRFPLGTLLVAQLVKKFSTCYWIWKLITVFARLRHWSLSWTRRVQFTSSGLFALRYIIISSSLLRLDLSYCLFPSDFPTRYFMLFFIPPIRVTCPVQHIPLHFNRSTNNWWSRKIVKLLIM